MIGFAPPLTFHDLIVVTQGCLPSDVLIATRITLATRIGKLDGLDRLAVQLGQAGANHRQFTRGFCSSLFQECKEIFALGGRDVDKEKVRDIRR